MWTARQLALIPPEYPLTISVVNDRPVADEGNFSPDHVEYDETHTYVRTARFDHAGRPRAMTLPRDPDFHAEEEAPIVGGLITYNRRGLPAEAAAFIGCDPTAGSIDDAENECIAAGGAVQRIVEHIEYERDGLVTSLRYGDHGPTGNRRATEAQTLYDDRRRPELMSVFREADLGAVAPELSAVLVPFSQELTWDAASNLVAISDLRMENEWPSGYLPQSVEIRHDSLYRVIRARYQYTQADGSLDRDDAATDWRTSMAATYAHDPMRTEPAPSVSTMGGSRVRELNWSWDYLANTTSWTDDASRFYERSIGAIVNGDDLGDAERPSAIRLSTSLPRNAEGQLGADAGWLEVDYGSGGNVHVMTVHGQCADVEPQSCVDSGHPHFDTRRNLLRQNCACASEQHYEYRWDELNRLIEARRFDRIAGGDWELEVRQRYRYDAANQRVVKQTLDQDSATCGDGAGLTPCERIALYVYPGDFERRGLRRGFDGYEADETLRTETQYLIAGARTVWRQGDADFAFDEDHRLTVVLADLIETNAAVMDVRTGELLEASTYYPNGGRETFRANESGAQAPESSGFTGKEADDDVGLVYFGERFLIPRAGRWAAPDPLHVHAVGGGETLNSYHYVNGGLLADHDELGLNRSGRRQPQPVGPIVGPRPFGQRPSLDFTPLESLPPEHFQYETFYNSLPPHLREMIHTPQTFLRSQWSRSGWRRSYWAGRTEPGVGGVRSRTDVADQVTDARSLSGIMRRFGEALRAGGSIRRAERSVDRSGPLDWSHPVGFVTQRLQSLLGRTGNYQTMGVSLEVSLVGDAVLGRVVVSRSGNRRLDPAQEQYLNETFGRNGWEFVQGPRHAEQNLVQHARQSRAAFTYVAAGRLVCAGCRRGVSMIESVIVTPQRAPARRETTGGE